MISEELYQDSMFRLTATYAPWQAAGNPNGAVYIAECELGRGVFARRALRKGDLILAFGGPLIDFAETRRRGPRECMAIQVGPDQYIDTLAPGVFVNHSCAPNAGSCGTTASASARPDRPARHTAGGGDSLRLLDDHG